MEKGKGPRDDKKKKSVPSSKDGIKKSIPVSASMATVASGTSAWSKSKKKRMRQLKGKHNLQSTQQPPNNSDKNTKSAQKRSPNEEETRPRKKGKFNSFPVSSSSSSSSATQPAKDSKETQGNSPSPEKKSSSLIESFKARLTGSRFRTLNEELYTTTSQESFERFSKNPELFQEYHDGFRHQVNAWPVNPVSVIVEKIKAMQTERKKNNNLGKMVVADFGCGEAQLAQELLSVARHSKRNDVDENEQQVQEESPDSNKAKKRNKYKKSQQHDEREHSCPFQVHSFDLVQPPINHKTRHLVTPCDMAHVPLPSSSVDVGVFCLALMGTNLADFVREAHRVLKPNGSLWIAEVQSRFSSSTTTTTTSEDDEYQSRHQKQQQQRHYKQSNDSKGGWKETKNGNHPSIQYFLEVLQELGFRCVQKDLSNKMFFLLRLVKSGTKPKDNISFTAKPCIYKRR